MHILEKEGLTPNTLGLLMFIKLNSLGQEYIHKVLQERLYDIELPDGRNPIEILEELDYVKYITTGRKDPIFRLRLSSKGEDVLKELNQKPLHELAQMTLDYTREEYQRIGADKMVKGGGKILNYISEFLFHKEHYNEKMIKAVIKSYVTQFEYDQKYLNNMGTLFFKPTNAYATKWTPEDSPIISFIDKNQDTIKYTYSKLQ